MTVMFASALSGRAQIVRVDIALDGFLCNNDCRVAIEHALEPFGDALEDVDISFETRSVTLIPNEDALVGLWDIRKELQNSGRAPRTIAILATGSIGEYVVSLDKSHLHTRKTLQVGGGDARFVLSEGEELDALLAYIRNEGMEDVAVYGKVVSFIAKRLPVLVVHGFKTPDDDWSEKELQLRPDEEETETTDED